MHKRPFNLLWGNTSINSCYLWKEGYTSVWQTFRNSLPSIQVGQTRTICLKCRVTAPVKLTCSLCTKSLGRNVGQKLIMWSGKWGLYQEISQGLQQICLHMLAQDKQVPCDPLGYYLFRYKTQSHLHLMNLMVFESQSPNVSGGCHHALLT